VFDAGQAHLRAIIKEMNLARYVNDITLMSYDDLVKRHMAASH